MRFLGEPRRLVKTGNPRLTQRKREGFFLEAGFSAKRSDNDIKSTVLMWSTARLLGEDIRCLVLFMRLRYEYRKKWNWRLTSSGDGVFEGVKLVICTVQSLHRERIEVFESKNNGVLFMSLWQAADDVRRDCLSLAGKCKHGFPWN